MSAMPDIEAMELVEQFFTVGSTVVGTANPVAIFLAGCRECLPEWELQAACRARTGGGEQILHALAADSEFCLRGQTRVRPCLALDRGEGARLRGGCGPGVPVPWAVVLPAAPSGLRSGQRCSRERAGAAKPVASDGVWMSITSSNAHRGDRTSI